MTEAHFVEAGVQVFYVCAVHPKTYPYRSHYVLAGPFLTEAAAREAAPEAFQAASAWNFENGGVVGIVTIPTPWHRGRVWLVPNGAFVLSTLCEACLIAEPDSTCHASNCPVFMEDAAHGWAE